MYLSSETRVPVFLPHFRVGDNILSAYNLSVVRPGCSILQVQSLYGWVALAVHCYTAITSHAKASCI